MIGIDDYPEFRSLQGARKDAEDFHEWLIDAASGGGLPRENAELVLSELNPLRPTQDDIEDALKRIRDRIAAEPKGAERLYLYCSGHGMARQDVGADLCLAKWSREVWRSRALDSQEYLNMIVRSGLFREVVFFLDCCRVQIVRTNALRPGIELSRNGTGAAQCRYLIAYATEYTDLAYEAETGGGNGDVRGYFTQTLMEALRGAAADPSGGVLASKLKDYLEVHTPLLAKEGHHSQTPEVRNGLKGGDEPMFGSAKPPEPVMKVGRPMSSPKCPLYRMVVMSTEPGLGVRVIDANGTIVGRCEVEQDRVEQDRVELDLPLGLYTVRGVRGGLVNDKQVWHDKEQTIRAEPPKPYSAATIPNAETTHECYADAAWWWSQHTTTDKDLSWNGPVDARLMIFVRAPKEDLYDGQDQLASLSLRTLDGLTLSRFGSGTRNGRQGWAAYSVHLSPGLLLLEDHGAWPRQIQVPLFSGWQTRRIRSQECLVLANVLKAGAV